MMNLFNYMWENIKFYTQVLIFGVAYNAIYNAAKNVINSTLREVSRNAYLISGTVIQLTFDYVSYQFKLMAEQRKNFLIQEFPLKDIDLIRTIPDGWEIIPRDSTFIEMVIPYNHFKYLSEPVNIYLLHAQGIFPEIDISLNIYDIIATDLMTYPQLLDLKSIHQNFTELLDIIPFDLFISDVPLFHVFYFFYMIRRLTQYGVFSPELLVKAHIVESVIRDIFSPINTKRNYTLLYIKLSTLITYLRGTDRANKLIHTITNFQRNLIIEIIDTYVTLYRLNEKNKRRRARQNQANDRDNNMDQPD